MRYDAQVAIIGAGPLGIELATALKLSNIPHLVFDKGALGQAIYDFPPQTHFFSSNERIGISGIPIQTLDQQKCTREQYLAYLRTVVNAYNLELNLFEKVDKIEADGGFTLHTSKKTYRVPYLVVATGGTAFNRRLGIQGEDQQHVTSKMVDPHLYFSKHVIVVGGKNSAAETVLRLFQAGAKPTLVMRAETFNPKAVKYWILPELEGRIKCKEIGFYPGHQVASIGKDTVELRHIGSGKETTLAADFVIKAIGFNADMSLLEDVGAELQPPNKWPVYNEETMETTIPNLFVLGTVVAGTQNSYLVFIENTHVHVQKILNCIASRLGLSAAVPNWDFKKQYNNSNFEQ